MPLPIHHLDRSTVVYGFDRAATPRLAVDAPCEVMVETHDARTGKLKRPEDEPKTAPNFEDRFPKTNPATGPILIVGAEPGDAVVAEVLRIDLDDYGFVLVKPNVGLVQGLVNRTEAKILPVIDGEVHFDGLRLPTRPMIGVMATAPAGESIGTAYIGRHGGNMDNNRITVGTKVHLPVRVPGAHFYVGDVHATMGDGEISGTGVEIGARVHLRLSLEKGKAREWPWLETRDHLITTASAPGFEEAAEIATRSMMELMGERLGVSPVDAFGLLSIAGDLRVNQYCRMVIGCSVRVEFPKLNAGFTRT
ncbi:MAG: acetamidase/formamidase family protein [Proteobacteria bacterium]|nr:acetamidase/formamidase family protein [Pseudomonadota bacterium]MBI3497498.1 acetamidase/formamidase family protein [Pseudomonadota bacterium]